MRSYLIIYFILLILSFDLFSETRYSMEEEFFAIQEQVVISASKKRRK